MRKKGKHALKRRTLASARKHLQKSVQADCPQMCAIENNCTNLDCKPFKAELIPTIDTLPNKRCSECGSCMLNLLEIIDRMHAQREVFSRLKEADPFLDAHSCLNALISLRDESINELLLMCSHVQKNTSKGVFEPSKRALCICTKELMLEQIAIMEKLKILFYCVGANVEDSEFLHRENEVYRLVSLLV